jgi:hypothetical protein
MAETIEIRLDLTNVGSELKATVAEISEGLTTQFKVLSQNVAKDGNTIVKEVKAAGKNLTDALKEGDWQEIFTILKGGGELPTKVKDLVGNLQEYLNSYKGLVWEKILPEAMASQVKNRVDALKQYFSDLQKHLTAGDWENLSKQLLPEKIWDNIISVKDGVEKAKQWVNGIKQAFQDGGLKQALAEVLPEDLYDRIFAGKDIYNKVKDYVDQIKQAFTENGLGGALEKLFSQDFQDQFIQSFKGLQDWLQQIPATLAQAFQSIWSNVGDFFTGITGKLGEIWNFMAGLPGICVQTFQSIWSVLGNVFNSLTNMLTNVWQFLLKIINNAAGWLFGLPGKAEGGGVAANRPYIVGEKGPEVFVPQVSGYIVPNNQLSGNGSFASAAPRVTVNVINNTGQQVTARQEESFDGQQYVVGVWLDALSRNVGGLRDVIMVGR